MMSKAMISQPTAEVNLLPCPFYGGEPSMVDAEIDGRVHYIVKCGTCHCTSGVMQMSRSKAAEAWNRRAERTCSAIYDGDDSGHEFAGKSWHCSNCGHEMDEYEAKCGVYCIECGAKLVGE